MKTQNSSLSGWIQGAGYGVFLIAYNAAYLIFALLYLPHFLYRSRQADKASVLIRQRFGFGYPSLKEGAGRRIWIHAVSVGEALAVRSFVEKISQKNSDAQILISTVTPTGQKIAKTFENERVTAVYFPFDWSFSVAAFLNHFRPEVLLLAETEIWPNLLAQSRRRNLPVIVLNARLSEKSFRRYQQFKLFFEPIFQSLSGVLAQTEKDQERFSALGVGREKIRVAGNMKFDQAEPSPESRRAAEELRAKWNLNSRENLWIAGSTHRGEEESLLAVFSRVRSAFPQLKLLIAPRHIDRAAEIQALGQKSGLRVSRASDAACDFDVLILDQLGVLSQIYALSSLVFVGGSLIRHGGQNPIEAARFECALIHGPYTFNFESTYGALRAGNASLLVQHQEELETVVRQLMKDPASRAAMGVRAREVISRYQGSVQKQLDWVIQFLNSQPYERGYHAERKELFPSRC